MKLCCLPVVALALLGCGASHSSSNSVELKLRYDIENKSRYELTFEELVARRNGGSLGIGKREELQPGHEKTSPKILMISTLELRTDIPSGLSDDDEVVIRLTRGDESSRFPRTEVVRFPLTYRWLRENPQHKIQIEISDKGADLTFGWHKSHQQWEGWQY